MSDLSIIYYTANYLEVKNPVFFNNTLAQLLRAADGLPIVAVSHKPMAIPGAHNIVVGDIGRSHLNIYRQILVGCKAAKTKWVAMAEDDILYSYEHFHPEPFLKVMLDDTFYYDMMKVSLFTWITPPLFSFRTKRRVVNHLIAPRQMLIDALEERFARLEVLKAEIREKHPEIADPEAGLIKYWGDPGRYEDLLGVTPRRVEEFYTNNPSIVFSHTYAYGYEYNQGKKKRLGDLRIVELDQWGRAEDILKLWGDAPKE